MGVTRAAAAALGQALVCAAEGRFHEDAIALVRPSCRRSPLHDAHHLMAGNEGSGRCVGGEHIGRRVAVDEREVGAAYPRERGADQHPAGARRHRGSDIAHFDGDRGALLRVPAPATAPTAGAGVDEGRIDD
jgi:hypothetical protein